MSSSSSSGGVVCAGLGPSEELIDDMDDGKITIPNVHGRAGAWTTIHDTQSPGAMMWPPDGMFAMASSGDPCRLLAVHVYGGQYTVYAGFEVGLGGPYNASAYKGVTLWARVGPNASPYVRLAFPDKNTDPAGGICSTAAGTANECYDYFGRQLALTQTWTKYTIRFADLSPLGWGNQAPAFDPSTLFRLEWDIPAGATFDIWVDDVSFLTQ